MTRFAVIVVALLAPGLGDDGKPVPRTWRYPADNGQFGSISGCDGSDWKETRPAGLPPITFKFVRHTNRFTELFDEDRKFTLILYSDGESEWSVGDGWNNWLKGSWDSDKAPAAWGSTRLDAEKAKHAERTEPAHNQP
ncbi:hypothetical protein [Paludisphaera rhizosphaerae]|uniref:hypothetical protein n=1 Tax=Paludisphaera rhizosphaerae TaxID=2711216 RepID=UPI0013EABA86|nr:hypothetical protein [Paludisphaera rhizosphaerae]